MGDPSAAFGLEPKPVTTFASCSRKIRDNIYRYCLVTAVEIIPYPEPHEQAIRQSTKHQYPSPALLAINKTFGREARSILYGENHWRLSSPALPLGPPTIFEIYPSFFHSLTIAFDHRDLPFDDKKAISRYYHDKVENIAMADIAADNIHRDYLGLAARTWAQKSRLLLSLQHARSITVQLEEFFCPSGCCRSALLCDTGAFYRKFLKRLTARELRLSFPALSAGDDAWEEPKVFVRGLRNDVERKLVYSDYGFEEVKEEWQSLL